MSVATSVVPARGTLFSQVTFIGIGLVNGSLARDIRRLGLADHLVATARKRETLDRACELDLVDEATTEIAAAVHDSDLIVLGVPVGACGALAAAIAPHVRADAIVTDVGSVKASVVDAVAPYLDMRRFVPGHPVAGTENSGPDAAIDGLFDGRWCILTPGAQTDSMAVERVAELWRAVGSNIELMDAAHHDRVLAITSHLPHLLAFNMMTAADGLEGMLKGEVLKYAAGGFAGFTRIAAADPVMWRDVFLQNKKALLEVLSHYVEDLVRLQRAVRCDEADTLLESFQSARSIRLEVLRTGHDYKRQATKTTNKAPVSV